MADLLKICDIYAIPNINLTKPNFENLGKAISDNNLGTIIKLKTNSGARTLDVIV